MTEVNNLEVSTKPDPKSKKDPWGKSLQVDDEQAPLLFSKRAIYTFSFFFSVLAGAILMVLNTRNMKRHDAIVPILSFAIGYLTLAITVINLIESYFKISIPNSSIAALSGGMLLTHFLWGKYIGDETLYRKRKTLFPGLICTGFLIVFLIILVYVEMGKTTISDNNSLAVVHFNGGDLEYDSTLVLKNDAKAIGESLLIIGYFNPQSPSLARLTSEGSNFNIVLEIKYEYFEKKEILTLLSDYAKVLNNQYSNQKSFTIIAYSIDKSNHILKKEITAESTF